MSLRPSTPTEWLPQGAQHPLEGATCVWKEQNVVLWVLCFPSGGKKRYLDTPLLPPVTVTVTPTSYPWVLNSTLTLITAGHRLWDVWRVLPAP